MNVFEEFLRELFNGEPMIREANICGRSVIGKVDDQIIVKIVHQCGTLYGPEPVRRDRQADVPLLGDDPLFPGSPGIGRGGRF